MNFIVKSLEQDVLCITVFDRDLFSPNGKVIHRKRCFSVIVHSFFFFFFFFFEYFLYTFYSFFVCFRLSGPHRSKLGEAFIKRQRTLVRKTAIVRSGNGRSGS